MSDFLNQFDKDNYKKKETNTSVPEKEVNKNNVEISFSKPQKAAITSTEHETVIDKNYNKSKIIRYLIIGAIVIVVLILLFIGFRLLNRVTVKDFVGTSVSDAKTWGLKNKIEFDITYEFITEYDNDIVSSQDIRPQEKIQKGSIIYIVVSKGADPEEKIELPDFSQMTTEQVRTWIQTNKTQSVTIVQEYNETVEANKFIRMEYRDENIEATNFKRKDGLTVYMSKGVEEAANNIDVPDFTGKTKMEVDTWAGTNDIKITYVDKGSEKVPEQCVISQSIKAGEKVAKKAEMTIDISIGKGAKVPNFNNVPMQSAATYSPDLAVTVTTKYSSTVEYGRVISQSVKSGATLYGDKRTVSVVYSEGRPYIDDLTTKTEKDLAPYFYEFKSKGANITYAVTYVDGSEAKGSVKYATKKSEFVDMTTHIDIQISLGNLTPPEPPAKEEESNNTL